jgi:cytochrome c biogenesis protein CcmG, thiol:disulfide interchange protein DsbE
VLVLNGIRGMKIAAWAMVAGTAVLAVAFSTRFGSDPGLSASPLIGRPVPDLTLPALDGSGEVNLAALQGDILVVNFFASWCPGCRTEHAGLLATSRAFADRGVRFVQIAYDDRPDDSRAFLDELGTTPETLYLSDVSSSAAIGFGLRGVPETYFVDAAGIVQGKISGETNALILGETLDTMIEGGTPGEQVVGEVLSRD